MTIVHATRRIALWGAILGALNIKYIPHTAVKGQVLTNLVVEIIEPSSNKMTEAQHMDGKSVSTVSLHRTFCLEGYMLMVLQIKGGPKWG